MNEYLEKLKAYWPARMVAALKTFVQTLAGFFTANTVGITEIDWKAALSVSAAAGLYSLLMSIVGMPMPGKDEGGEDK